MIEPTLQLRVDHKTDHSQPEFNPIEECWAKLKDILRRMLTKTRIAFDPALAKAEKFITKSDLSWIRHAGYSLISS